VLLDLRQHQPPGDQQKVLRVLRKTTVNRGQPARLQRYSSPHAATLYAELNLLGHEELRSVLAQKIREKYLGHYAGLLEKLEKKAMSHEEVKAYCAARKINLNKFGKHSHAICIHSPQALAELLDYH
jgi:hypothetical protein